SPRLRHGTHAADSTLPFATIAANVRDGSIPAVHQVESNRQGRTHFGHSPFPNLRLRVFFTEYGIECLRQTIADERAAGHAPELFAEVGDGMKGVGRRIVGVFSPPLLH